MQEEKLVFTSIGVPMETRQLLKQVAAQSGEHMYIVVQRLVSQEKSRLDRMQYVPQGGTA